MATFGYTTLGTAGSTYIYSPNIVGSVFACPEDATVTSITMGINENSARNFKGIIVLKSNLNLVTNGVSDVVVGSGSGAQWVTANFSTPPTLTGGVEYVLMSISDNFPAWLTYDAGSSNQGYLDSSNSYTTPTNPTDATNNNNKYSIYVSYTPTAGGTPVTIDVTGSLKQGVKIIG